MTSVILWTGDQRFKLKPDSFARTSESNHSMSDSKANAAVGTDWTGLLADPDLARNLGKLLQTYRDAPPERREEALLAAMREIKKGASSSTTGATSSKAATEPPPQPLPTPASASPPFEPDIFSPNWGQDRRRHPRIKCFVAVELRVNDADAPIWGNLSNTSLGGCQVETANHISGGAKVEIGLWVASGKIWVKGLALNGVVTRSAAAGVRIRFAGMDSAEKENLRQFLKYVQETTRASMSESSYLQLLK
jgi:PilZ domain